MIKEFKRWLSEQEITNINTFEGFNNDTQINIYHDNDIIECHFEDNRVITLYYDKGKENIKCIPNLTLRELKKEILNILNGQSIPNKNKTQDEHYEAFKKAFKELTSDKETFIKLLKALGETERKKNAKET